MKLFSYLGTKLSTDQRIFLYTDGHDRNIKAYKF